MYEKSRGKWQQNKSQYINVNYFVLAGKSHLGLKQDYAEQGSSEPLIIKNKLSMPELFFYFLAILKMYFYNLRTYCLQLFYLLTLQKMEQNEGEWVCP